MEKGLGLEILFVDECDSTHLYVSKGVKNGTIKPPFAICARMQNAGVGSRGNEWIGLDGNLFMSFCLKKSDLPEDLPEPSASIYFSMIMANFLQELGSKIWVKWPNDFYVQNAKIGGVISTKIDEFYIGSVGLNLARAPKNAGVLDIKIEPNALAIDYVNELVKKFSWKQIFSKFKIEFAKSKSFITHINGKPASLSDAQLCEDGAILLDKTKVYSLR